jgi:hypothetical protein
MGLRDYAKRHWIHRAAEMGGPAEPPQDDAELFVTPPGAQAVARRAAILAAVVGRGLIEDDDTLRDGQAAIDADLAFYRDLDLARDAEPAEDALITAPHGTLERQATIDAIWRAEGLAVLAWALGRLDELPPIDMTADLGLLAERLALPWTSASEVVVMHAPELRRAPEEIAAAGTMLLTAHWRVRQFMHVDPSPMDFVAWVPGAEWADLSLDGLEVAERDLAIGGEPIAGADPDRVEMTASVLVERRLAISWLQGYDALYSEGDTNT